MHQRRDAESQHRGIPLIRKDILLKGICATGKSVFYVVTICYLLRSYPVLVDRLVR